MSTSVGKCCVRQSISTSPYQYKVNDFTQFEHDVTLDGSVLYVDDPELFPIVDAGPFPVVVHGTYFKAWERIKTEGLRKMNRTHIHFAKGVPGDGGVISGMRGSCQLMIYINLHKALKDGIPFFLSKNEVILSPGDTSGCLFPCYFSEVVQRRPRKRLDFDVQS